MPDVAAEFKFFVLFLATWNHNQSFLSFPLSETGDAELVTERIEKVLAQ